MFKQQRDSGGIDLYGGCTYKDDSINHEASGFETNYLVFHMSEDSTGAARDDSFVMQFGGRTQTGGSSRNVAPESYIVGSGYGENNYYNPAAPWFYDNGSLGDGNPIRTAAITIRNAADITERTHGTWSGQQFVVSQNSNYKAGLVARLDNDLNYGQMAGTTKIGFFYLMAGKCTNWSTVYGYDDLEHYY